ncbi:hypothetical protein ACFQH5_16560 [Halomonas salifodinae]|uniref:Uncharacterized protein n=1 Tax=Halomonas salifodinae TaxID=438745 RepID=A0ABW2F2E3_9GAMM
MNRSPLPPTYTRPEKIGGKRNQHLIQNVMELPDLYHTISETPLREKIETGKRSLHEAYYFISRPEHTLEDTPALENKEEQAEETFQQEYAASCAAIKNGHPASQHQEHIKSALCSNVMEDLQNTFSAAFIWLVCADLLEKEDLRDQSWASLVEFSSLEYRLELACMAEHARREKIRHQKNGAKANAKYANLKKYLIEFLYTEAPENGWRAVKKAANELAKPIRDRHESSEHRAVYEVSLPEVETLIENWMYKDEDAKQAYKKNKKKRG